MKKDLFEAYLDLQDSLFDDDYTKIKIKKNFENTFNKYTEEELKEELQDLEIYVRFLKKQIFYTFDYKEVEEGIIAFNPEEIYKLYLEKDLAIYNVLSECTDDYIKEVIKFFVAHDYDDQAIMLLANFMRQRSEFKNE